MANKFIATVNVKGAKELIRKFADTGYLVEQPLSDMMESLTDLARDVAVRTSHSTQIARSVVVEVAPLQGIVRFPIRQAATLNKGRKPGAKMPSTRQIAAWANAHGIDPELHWVLAQTIAKRGIKGRFFVRKARAAVRQSMPAHLDRMARSVERRFSA